MGGKPNRPSLNRTCKKCKHPAESGHHHCCMACRSSGGRYHGHNCTGNTCPGRAPPSAVAVNPQQVPPDLSSAWQMPETIYRPPPWWTRKREDNLVQFIQCFVPEGEPDFPREKWEMLEWTLNKVHRARPVILVPLSAHQHFSGRVLDCRTIDARGNYDMGSVTGVDHKVISHVCLSMDTTSVLRDAVDLIEDYNLRCLGIKCTHATHRSVVIIGLLLMLAYPEGGCIPFTRRVQEAMHFWWLERSVSTAECMLLTELIREGGRELA